MRKHTFKPRVESLENRITPSRYAPPGMTRAAYDEMVIKQVNAEINALVDSLSSGGHPRDKKDRVKWMLEAMFAPKKISPVSVAAPKGSSSSSSPPKISGGSAPKPVVTKFQKPKKFVAPQVQQSAAVEEDEDEDTMPDDTKAVDEVFILGFNFLKKKEEEEKTEEKKEENKKPEEMKVEPKEADSEGE